MERNPLAIPGAIVIAAVLIAGAVYLSGQQSPAAQPANNAGDTAEQPQAPQPARAVDGDDYIRGNPNAPIVFIEYSDYECPFCGQFHETMKRVIDEYGKNGQVAWVYRHFPLTQLHPNAFAIAEASECVGALGGNDAFWNFSDAVFANKPQNGFTDLGTLPGLAAAAGVDRAAFEQCVANNTYRDKVQEDVDDALASGGQGTPHTIVVAGTQQEAINGAQPYVNVKGLIDSLLLQISDNSGR